MSQNERYGTRDMAYSAFHRTRSASRFISYSDACSLSMIDLDQTLWIEWAKVDGTSVKLPLLLIETVQKGQPQKPASVLLCLADMAKLPAFVVHYTLGEQNSPASADCKDIVSLDIERLRRPSNPRWETHWESNLTPLEYFKWLIDARAFYKRRLLLRADVQVIIKGYGEET